MIARVRSFRKPLHEVRGSPRDGVVRVALDESCCEPPGLLASPEGEQRLDPYEVGFGVEGAWRREATVRLERLERAGGVVARQRVR